MEKKHQENGGVITGWPNKLPATKRALSFTVLTTQSPCNKSLQQQISLAIGGCKSVSTAAIETTQVHTMEAAAAAATSASARHKKSSSFSLRSPSLNSLRLRRVFDLFDKNGDGMITIQEISQALSLLGLDADFSELELTIKSHIKPDNIGLSFEDFVSLHQSLDNSFFGYDNNAAEEEASANDIGDQARMRMEESDLSESFKVFDEDGDGYISAHELQVVLRKLGLPEAKETDRIQKMIITVDSNHDGRVDLFEFKEMMRSVLARSS